MGKEHEMADEWWLHVPCNDRHGNFDGYAEVGQIAVYVGNELALTVEGMERGFRLSHEEGRHHLKFYGVGYFPYAAEANYVGNIHWNAYRMEPAEVCRLLTRLRDAAGWQATDGWAAVFDACTWR